MAIKAKKTKKTSRPVTKKAATKKTATKKTTAKKATTKKTVAKKAAARKSVRKTAAKKPAARKKTPAKKSTPKKTAAKKTARGKTTSKNTASKNTGDKKTAIRKQVAAKTTAGDKARPAPKSSAGKNPAKKQAATTKKRRPAFSKATGPTKAAPKVLEKKSRPETKSPAPPVKKVVKPAFKPGEFVVYPAHGVGQVTEIQEQQVAGYELELFVIHFEQDKMTLRVPTNKAVSVGMRKLSGKSVVDNALETLKGKPKVKRTMWSRRAQEYEQKINSGNLVFVSEVVRDLFRADYQPEQSYSERQLYEAALDRMARELAAIAQTDTPTAASRIETILQNAAAPPEPPAEGDAASSSALAS